MHQQTVKNPYFRYSSVILIRFICILYQEVGEATSTWVRPVIAIGLTLLGVAVSTFGLTGLIAKGYGTVCWGFLIVYVIPMLTIGIYKISKAGK